MRNPDRIDEFTNELNRIWKTYYTDWRFGQFMSNFFSWLYSVKKIDMFFPEEDKMLEYLKEFTEKE